MSRYYSKRKKMHNSLWLRHVKKNPVFNGVPSLSKRCKNGSGNMRWLQCVYVPEESYTEKMFRIYLQNRLVEDGFYD